MIQLEDFHEDILGKAMRGLGVGKNAMAVRINVEKSQIESVLSGQVDEEVIRLMALQLQLDPRKLICSAHKEWRPSSLRICGLKQFNQSYGEMYVNAYVIWEIDSLNAWIFDTGPDHRPICDFLKSHSLRVDSIFLTHTHGDHITCLSELLKETGNPRVYVHATECFAGCTAIEEGFSLSLSSLSLSSFHTHGHSVGGITYFLNGLTKPIAIVGDAVFAGSMGGGMVSYGDALRTNREKIMTLPNETILCPGHGPMTTVIEEKKHNPFFPEFKT